MNTIEGIYNGVLRYHYDVSGDVLYLRLLGTVEDEVYGDDEDERGRIPIRSVDTDRLVGFTVWSFWRRSAANAALVAAGNPEEILERSIRELGDGLLAA
ncbi:MAG: hypothetical protein HYU66_23840 [Armatimonadetes bacterium]|nr:hypothetical protein [Armatimonadota bacterium]